MSFPDAVALLALTPLFQGAGREQLTALAGRARFRRYDTHDAVFRAGDAADTLSVVARGSVRVYRAGPGGREFTLGIEGPRQMLDLAAVLDSAGRHTAHAHALGEPTQLLSVPADLARHIILHTPALAGAVITHLARREADGQRRLDALVFSGVGARLAAYLLDHAGAPHALPRNSELAALLGTVPEIVSRKLGEFYRLGWIDLARRTVTVMNPAELQRVVTGD
ncbi:CRP/FNR family transcriptional regulator [Deinococcus metalli]|uniref:CRP/FNR family transcriptional regulator n=1 Tax=Deinococcus metalli TaxID=1141878 RepID=A0A7W8KIK6_9DEIO|nr:Crp/Fnr family transcriptional regulator [Deinococcus metalli]MBB5377671.1 CRP/FNR family transcriptional regulator [Deinococcus metalli]